MADRQVTQSRKDADGDITALCNPDEYWTSRTKAQVIHDIEKATHRYYVIGDGATVYVRVVYGSTGKHLRTTADKSSSNNLDNLPDC